MNKNGLIKDLAEKKDLRIEESSKIATAFVDTMKESLILGDRVEIRGFGSFRMRTYGGYSGRNSKTGTAVIVRPKRLPHFRPGKDLREQVNSGGLGPARPGSGSQAHQDATATW